jgi:hypothetical protein
MGTPGSKDVLSSLQFFKINSFGEFSPLALQFLIEGDVGRRDVGGLGAAVFIHLVGAKAAYKPSTNHIDLYRKICTKQMTTLSFLYSLNRAWAVKTSRISFVKKAL